MNGMNKLARSGSQQGHQARSGSQHARSGSQQARSAGSTASHAEQRHGEAVLG